MAYVTREGPRNSNLYSDARIPALEPLGLDIVPGFNRADPTWRKRYFAWREEVYRYRDERDEWLDLNPEDRAAELIMCADDPAYWLATWGWIDEPREVDDEGFDGTRPFVPFAGQVHVIRRFQDTLDERIRDLYISKSRGWGASWLFAALALHGWLFKKPHSVAILSRKEELVDKPHDMNSIFAKIDYIMSYLPEWMLPTRYERKQRMLKNLNNGNQITGESTGSKSTRGGRATWILYDEAAFMPGFAEVWGTGAGTTFHRVGVSTESFEESHAWFDAWTQQKETNSQWVMELDYHHNPAFDAEWERGERKRHAHDPEKFEIEYMRNPYVGEGWIYPTARNLPIVKDLEYDPANILVVGIDPGRADDTAVVWGQPIQTSNGTEGIAWLRSYERDLMMPEWFAHILTGIDPIPGDRAYADWQAQGGWSDSERLLVEWTRSLPWDDDSVRYFMDPAGQQKHLDHETWHSRLVAESYRLREAAIERGIFPPNTHVTPVYPLWQELRGTQGQHEHRRVVTRSYLPYFIFSADRSGRRIRECLEKSRFNSPGEQATGQPAPAHGKYSHVRSAVEYVCVYMSVGFANRAAALA